MKKALHLYEEAVKLAAALKDRKREAAALINIGGIYSDTGEPQKALAFYQQALPILRAVGDKAAEAAILSSISALSKPVGKP